MKPTKTRKLQLSRATVRTLSATALRAAAGGATGLVCNGSATVCAGQTNTCNLGKTCRCLTTECPTPGCYDETTYSDIC